MSKPFAYWSRLLTVSTLAVCLSFNPVMAGKVLKRILSKRCQTVCEPTNCFSDPCNDPCSIPCPPIDHCTPCDGVMEVIVSVPDCGCAIPSAPMVHDHSHSVIEQPMTHDVMPSVIVPSDEMAAQSTEPQPEMMDSPAGEIEILEDSSSDKMEDVSPPPTVTEIAPPVDNSSTDLAPPPIEESSSPFTPLESNDSNNSELAPPTEPVDPNGNGLDDLFGGSSEPAPATESNDLFGGADQPEPANDVGADALFGGDSMPAEQPSTSGGVLDGSMGNDATPPQQPDAGNANDLFGGQPAADSNTDDLFGGQPAADSNTDDLFGGQPAADSNTDDLFGGQPAVDNPTPPPADAIADDLFGGSELPAADATEPDGSAAPSDDLFGNSNDNLLGDQPATPPPANNPNPPAGDNSTPANDLFGDGDLFGEPPANEPTAPANPDAESGIDDLFGDGAPVSTPVQEDAELDALFNNPTNLEALPDPEPAASEPTPSVEETIEEETEEVDPFENLFGGAVRRTWTDNTGNFSVDAQLAEVYPDKVRLLKDNGKFATVPVHRLSQGDLRYVRWVVAQIDTDSARLVAQK